MGQPNLIGKIKGLTFAAGNLLKSLRNKYTKTWATNGSICFIIWVWKTQYLWAQLNTEPKYMQV